MNSLAHQLVCICSLSVIQDSVTYTEHARCKTVTPMDVIYALKRQGKTLYGFIGIDLVCIPLTRSSVVVVTLAFLPTVWCKEKWEIVGF
jgi:hypothetical protein